VLTQAELVMQIPRKQKGLALLMFVFVLVLAMTAYMLKGLNASNAQVERESTTRLALAQAKDALIGYAMTYDDDPTHTVKVFGYMPCPDMNASDPAGIGSQSSCGNAGENSLGRLPWKKLKISPIKDGYGECLWYAVSGSFKNNPKQPLAPTTPGQLSIRTAAGDFYAGSDADPIVAVVFSPGRVVSNQNRADSGEDEYCGGNYVASNYLDTVNNISNADASDSTFVVDVDNSVTFNDKLILITQSEIFNSYCGKYARKLASNVDITSNVNACLDTGAVSAACAEMRDNVQFCGAASCRVAADTLIDSACLNNPSDAACLAAVNALELCNA